MDIASGLAAYAIIWWLVLFTMLPIGVRVPPPDEVEKGMATSAPIKPRLWIKAGATTVIAAVIWLILRWAIASGWISLRG